MNNELKNPLDNPFMQLLTKIGELMIANFLFLVCSIPVVTVGAAAAGLNKVAQNIVLDQEGGVAKSFFKSFRENFKQATLLWLGEVVVAAAAVCYWLLISAFCQGTVRTVLNGLVLVISLLLLCVAVYLVPLMVRYENSLRQHLKNAMLISIVKLPRTLGLAGLALIGPVIAYLSVPVFVQTTFFWLMIGFGFVAYLSNQLLKPVFKELEKEENGRGLTVGM